MALPARERGLKLSFSAHFLVDGVSFVAPRAGAWIETYWSCGFVALFLVAPRAGAWIETNADMDNDLARDTASQMVAITVFTGNADRRNENWMIDTDTGQISAIDNGFACCMEVFGRDPWHETPYKRCERGWSERMQAHLGARGRITGVYIPGWKVKQEHVDAAEKLIASPELDEILERTFYTKDFQEKMAKYGHGYGGMTPNEISNTACIRAKRQMEAGLKFIKTKVT
jgi:hypothetical protein